MVSAQSVLRATNVLVCDECWLNNSSAKGHLQLPKMLALILRQLANNSCDPGTFTRRNAGETFRPSSASLCHRLRLAAQ